MGAIAHHWLEAQDSSDPAHTIDAVFQAAEQATERGGLDEAATLLARADARVGDYQDRLPHSAGSYVCGSASPRRAPADRPIAIPSAP